MALAVWLCRVDYGVGTGMQGSDAASVGQVGCKMTVRGPCHVMSCLCRGLGPLVKMRLVLQSSDELEIDIGDAPRSPQPRSVAVRRA